MRKILVIVGPTASGKTDLSIEFAKKFKGEIICADSRQVYKGMDIGTGKISKTEMQGVRHYLLDMVSPKTEFNVIKFVKHAKRAIRDIVSRGKLPIVVGGTGFWIDALLYDMDFPAVKQNKKLRAKLEDLTVEQLYKELYSLDRGRAQKIDSKNKRRVIRALEIIFATGKEIPFLRVTKPFIQLYDRGDELTGGRYNAFWVGISMSKDRLDRRIQKRFIEWLDAGLLDEIKKLHLPSAQGGCGVSYKRMRELGLAYRFGADLLENKINFTTFINLSVTSIRQYAKRQMTWFKRNNEIKWARNINEIFGLFSNFIT